MPVVIDPANGAAKAKANTSFTWDMSGVFYTYSKVIVGSSAGSDNIYPGKQIKKPASGTTTDSTVYHPGGNTICYTRPKYSKGANGGDPWYVLLSTINSFTST